MYGISMSHPARAFLRTNSQRSRRHCMRAPLRLIRACQRMARKVPRWFNHGSCCRTNRCRQESCAVILPRRGSLAIVSGTMYQNNHSVSEPLCDYICFWGDGKIRCIAPIELKARVNAEKVVRQLQQGANVGDNLSEEGLYVFRPVLASSRRLHPHGIALLEETSNQVPRRHLPDNCRSMRH